MNRYYHDRFFSDIRTSTFLILALFVSGWAITPEAFLLVPVVALIGANQTAFDASYLIFSRHYSAVLEDGINSAVQQKVLVASVMEDRYLFPLDKPKMVVAGLGSDFTWFSWMTFLYMLIGLGSFAAGIALGWPTLISAGGDWVLFYTSTLAVLTFGSLVVGLWWFVAGEGEARLTQVTETSFSGPSPRPKPERWPHDAA